MSDDDTKTTGTQVPGTNKVRLTMDGLCSTFLVSHECALKYIRDKDDPLPAMRFGRRWVFDLEAVEKWMTRRARRSLKNRRGRRAAASA